MWGELFAGIGQAMTTVVLPAAATAATGYATLWVKRQAKKAGLEVTEAQEAAGKRVVLDVLKQIEERSRRDGTMHGADKQRAAIELLLQQMALKGVTMAPGQAAAVIDTVLPDLRAEQALVDQAPAITIASDPAIGDVSRELLER